MVYTQMVIATINCQVVSNASTQWSSLITYQNARGVYIGYGNGMYTWGSIQCVDSVTNVMCAVLMSITRLLLSICDEILW